MLTLLSQSEWSKEKCLIKIRELCDRQGCTVVLVTHDLGIVKQLANRCVWLEGGRVRGLGEPNEIVASYLYLHAEQAKDAAAAMEDA